MQVESGRLHEENLFSTGRSYKVLHRNKNLKFNRTIRFKVKMVQDASKIVPDPSKIANSPQMGGRTKNMNC